jgi:hypothetical protein
MAAKNFRTRAERELDDALSTALAQPHRRQAVDPRNPRLGSALRRFCIRERLRDE